MTRSGADFLAGLRNDRTVYVNGERVADVTTHPAFAEAARSVAALYDLAHDPANRDVMTFPSPRDGRPVNKSWLVPRTREDLAARGCPSSGPADLSYGLLGRSPDHVASFFAGFAGGARLLRARRPAVRRQPRTLLREGLRRRPLPQLRHRPARPSTAASRPTSSPSRSCTPAWPASATAASSCAAPRCWPPAAPFLTGCW